jgi:hypothetical protein
MGIMMETRAFEIYRVKYRRRDLNPHILADNGF